jgi:3-oxoacyl-[acyl-carrier protein] reductase
MTKQLAGKVALVTGGSRGIGAAIAKRLARDGADVAITYASAQKKADEVVDAIKAEGVKGLAVRADSGDAGAVKNAVAQTVETLGRIDVLVNNAGALVVAPLDKFSLEDFDRMVVVNIRGVFAAAQEASRHMDNGGRIINIGSVNGARIPFAGGSVYAMTKAAVAGLTRRLARDLGPRGITVNTVHPGPTATDMNPPVGEFAESMKSMMAIGRYGETDEIAGLVSYLAGPEAAFVTGASLTIDGGYNA